MATVLALVGMLAATPSPIPAARGVMEGQLTMPPHRGVDVADEPTAGSHTSPAGEHALVVRSKAGGVEVTAITSDKKGLYRVALPPGDYILELKDSRPENALPRGLTVQREFTVTANETVRVDMQIPADIRQMR